MSQVFAVQSPQEKEIPIIISSPHSGVGFPEELTPLFLPQVLKHPADTDWFVDQVYGFAPDIGATLIKAHYSRYVIDLNRSADNESLYSDGRPKFDLVPQKQFNQSEIYQEALPDKREIQRRKDLYYFPYYNKISELIIHLKKKFKHVLFFDAHSIKRNVEVIRKDPFPDMILGNQDGKTSIEQLSNLALEVLKSSYDCSYNTPFKGGFLTRHFGDPSNGIHALQLEMSQDIYMDEENTALCPEKFARLQIVLKKLFAVLAQELESMNS